MSQATATIPRVKGTGIRAMLRFAEARGGAAAMKRVLERLSAEDRAIVDAQILPSSRYPEEFDHRVLLAVCEEIFGREHDRAIELGAAVLDEGMNIFSKLFLRMGDPAFLISKAGVLWKQYHEVGKLEVFDVTPKGARGRLTEYPWLDVQFCRVLAGAMIRALEHSGCRGIAVAHDRCIGRRDPHCEYRISWQ